MSKKKKEEAYEEWEQRFEKASTAERLQMGREFKAEMWERYGDAGGVTPEEYQQMDDTITYLEIATHFEATLSEQELREFPSRSQRAQLDAWWDWFGDICADRGRIARSMGLDEETIKRWCRQMNKYERNVSLNERAARARARRAAEIHENAAIADFLLEEMDENNVVSMYIPPKNALRKRDN